MTFLTNTYPAEIGGVDLPQCRFELVSSGQLAGEIEEITRVTLYLYRITVNEYSRQKRAAGRPADGPAPLHLDLHFLLSAWAANPLDEQVAMAWTMRQLHQGPVLDPSSLSPDGGWSRDEVVQIVPTELSNEDVMRIWDALEPSYRLSTTYVARIVRLDPDTDTEEFRSVVARRMAFGSGEVR
jgi:hypothetical protein